MKLFIYDNYYFIILSIFTNIFPFSETKILFILDPYKCKYE